MKVEVTQEDIRDGVRSNCRNCPVALACTRATGLNCYVDGGSVWVGCDSRAKSGRKSRLPEIATAFIDAFDEGGPVKPFTFELPTAK